MKKKENKKENILILSDSMSAIRNIGNNDISAYENMYVMEVRKRIYEIEKEGNRKVILAWILAHIGINKNEIAD